MSVQQIIGRIRRISRIRHICITGGEPLLQNGVYPLMRELLKKKYKVSLETSGTLDISRVPRDVVKVMDVKTPGSGATRNARCATRNLNNLNKKDEVKFVVTNKRDIDWSLRMIKKHKINRICHVSLSPVTGIVGSRRVHPVVMTGAVTGSWAQRAVPLRNATTRAILKSGLDNVRLQVQLHKILGMR